MSKALTTRGRRTRQRLLDAAEEVFGNKGYENASVAEITQKAGVAQGTFYIYFPDKKAAFTELVKELNHLVRRDISMATNGITDRMEAERIGFQTFFKFVIKRPNLYRIIRQAEFVDYSIFRWHYQYFSDGYVRQLKKAMKNNRLKQLDAETLAYCFMAIAEFMGMRWGLWEKKTPPKKAMDTLMTLLSKGMLLK
jgi:AcrR family transcriptional regulator